MRYAVVIILAVMLAGCDEAPAALGAGNGRGRYAGRCWKMQNDSAIQHLGANAGLVGASGGGPPNGRGVYTVWNALLDPDDPNAWQTYLLVFVLDDGNGNTWEPRYNSMRVCADRQLRPGNSDGINDNPRGDPRAEYYIGHYR